MKTLYLIPGTGADYRFFSRLNLDIPVKVIEWSDWGSANTISEYAKVLSKQINTNESFSILGVSYGGMLAIEMSKFLSPEKLIIVSSVKSYKELPLSVRIFGKIGIRYLIFPGLLKTFPFASHFFGLSKKEKKFFKKMLSDTPKDHLIKTLHSILMWRNTTYPENLIHIHGTSDKMIPIKNVQNSIHVVNGGHFMIYNKANVISEILNEKLGQKK